jgi:nucleoside phosphorylase
LNYCFVTWIFEQNTGVIAKPLSSVYHISIIEAVLHPELSAAEYQGVTMPQEVDFAKVHQLLIESYNLEELRTLCLQLSVPFDDLGGEGRQAKAREMLLWMNRRGRLDDLVAALAYQQPTASGKVDLAIVTAMPEELEPVFQLIGGREQWKPILLDQFVHHHAHFTFSSVSLSVVACSLWKYGGNPTTAEVLRLKTLQPRLIAMTGICAGWESKGIHFGDVIIADRAFHAGEGKLTMHGFEPDLRTYQPPPWLLQWLSDFASNKQWFSTMKTPRPRSLRYQAEWLLCQMAARGAPYPTTEADWKKVKANQIDFPRVRQLLIENGVISADGVLTHAAAPMLDELRRKNHGQLTPTRDPKQPAAHYGAFASTEAVIAVENPFLEHAQRVRKVRAIELEVASLFAAAAEIRVPAFAVKGVSDYGTPGKDDAFHSYAAEASARWMYKFIESYGQHLLSI